MDNQKIIAAWLTGAALLTKLYFFAYTIYSFLTHHANFFSIYNISFFVEGLITLTGIAAFIQFVVEKGRFSRLLQVYLLYAFYSTVIGLFTSFFLYVLQYLHVLEWGYAHISTLLINLALCAIFVYAALVIRKDRGPLFTLYGPGENPLAEFSPVDKWLRLANRVLDSVFLLVMLLTKLSWFYYISHSLEQRGLYLGVIFIYAFIPFAIFLYYILFETLFKVTLGKLVTNTTVVNENGEGPGLLQVTGRTLCRIIPFGQWSFLFNDRGWHDSFSGTYVVREKYAWQNNETAS